MVLFPMEPDLLGEFSLLFHNLNLPSFSSPVHVASWLYLTLSLCQDALTDLTGDSERLPVEEQHGNWLGHKVTD